MQDYIVKLTEALRELTGKPVTLGRAEEINVYADALCAVKRLRGGEDMHKDFDRETAMRWMDCMENADGTTGPHWTMEQTSAVAESLGIHGIEPWTWGAAMNMMHSDYYPVAVEFGTNRPDFYAALAKAFLLDKDGPGPERKLMEYYEHIAKRSVQS